MTGRRYYFTTLGAWRRHAAHCAETHFVTVNGPGAQSGDGCIGSQSEEAGPTDDATRILALVDADEGAHLAMENDAEFETLPHPLARMPVSQRVGAALAHFGVAQGDDTFTVAEKLACANPLLRHRVF